MPLIQQSPASRTGSTPHKAPKFKARRRLAPWRAGSPSSDGLCHRLRDFWSREEDQAAFINICSSRQSDFDRCETTPPHKRIRLRRVSVTCTQTSRNQPRLFAVRETYPKGSRILNVWESGRLIRMPSVRPSFPMDCFASRLRVPTPHPSIYQCDRAEIKISRFWSFASIAPIINGGGKGYTAET